MRHTRMIGLALASMLIAALLSPAASADIADTFTIKIVSATMSVGNQFVTPCTKQGTGLPAGKGLALTAPVGPKPNGKTAVYSLATPVRIVGPGGIDLGGGLLRICGEMGPNAAGQGASCTESAGFNGKGKLFALSRVYKIYDLGWQGATGTLSVTAKYRKIASANEKNRWLKNEGTMNGVLATAGGAACATKTAAGGGATSLTVAGTVVANANNNDPMGSPKTETDKCAAQPAKEGC